MNDEEISHTRQVALDFVYRTFGFDSSRIESIEVISTDNSKETQFQVILQLAFSLDTIERMAAKGKLVEEDDLRSFLQGDFELALVISRGAVTHHEWKDVDID